MPMIQMRNVPVTLHRELKARAARAGMTLSEYLLQMAQRSLERPETDELLRRIRERPPIYLAESPAEAVRAERDAR